MKLLLTVHHINVPPVSATSQRKLEHLLEPLLRQFVLKRHFLCCAGVWTDGIWVFSTGLDQRVRCWHLEEDAKLTEHCHLVISVPEPETLDARACSR